MIPSALPKTNEDYLSDQAGMLKKLLKVVVRVAKHPIRLLALF